MKLTELVVEVVVMAESRSINNDVIKHHCKHTLEVRGYLPYISSSQSIPGRVQGKKLKQKPDSRNHTKA